MTNKELQTFLKQFDDDTKMPDHICLQLFQLSSHFCKEHYKKVEEKDND